MTTPNRIEDTPLPVPTEFEYRKTVKRLFSFLYPQAFFLFLAVVGFAIYAVTQPMSAVLIEWLIKTLDGDLANGAVLVPAAFVGVALFRGIGTYMGGYYIAKVAERMVESIRKELFANIVQLPTKDFDQFQSGKLVSLFTYNTGLMSSVAARSVTIIAQEGLTVIALLAYLFYANWKFTSTFLLLAPPIALIINWAGKKIKNLGQDMQSSMAALNGNVAESFGGIRLIKAVAAESQSKDRFDAIATKTRKLSLNIAKVNSIYTPTMQIMIAIAMAVVVIFVIRAKGDMETAQLIAYVTAAALISKPIRSLSGVHLQLTQAVVAATEVFAFIDRSKELNQGQIEANNMSGELTFDNVCFRYANSESAVIDNLSMTAKAGETIALVGRSGGGKSTIANLIPRFYDIESGTIQIDGIDIRDYELQSLRRGIATVSQQVVLFNTSVADNIAFGIDHPGIDAIKAAAEQANAHEFIAKLPQGYETPIGENGVLLSGGQRQRIAIARAILRQAKVLILDEATSALDNESEAKVQNALDNIMGQCTTLVIAHRLSTIERADKIYVIDGGRVVESGNHTTLKNSSGLYAKMLAKDFATDER